MARPPITLTTDFGLRDSYVAQMKGVILGIYPEASIVDVTHEVSQGDVRQASWIIEQVAATFPTGSLHVIVVDPGVGSERRLVALEAFGQRFLAPDNGCLSELLRLPQTPSSDHPLRLHVLEDDRYWRSPRSTTFHGRDILAPTAAHWGLGVDAACFGPAIDLQSLVLLPASLPEKTPTGWRGEIIAVDHFGNLITNLRDRDLSELPNHEATVLLASDAIAGIDRFYAARPAGSLLALFGSSGRLEIAIRDGNAADRTGGAVGTPVHVLRSHSPAKGEFSL